MIAIIPARFAAQRLPGKPLLDLAGRPLIVRVCENAQASGVFDRIVVATDHVGIAEVARQSGFEAVQTDAALPSGTDRVAAAARVLGLPDDALVVNVQGDEPFVSAATLRTVAQRLEQSPTCIATAVEPITELASLRDQNVVKTAIGEDDRALYFSRAAIPFNRDAAATSAPESPGTERILHAYRHIGVYAFRLDTLRRIAALPPHPLETTERLEQLRWLAHGERIFAPTVAPSPRGIDTAEDLLLAIAYMQALS